MRSVVNKPTHVTRGSVLDELGFPARESAALKFKAELYQAVLKCARKYSQKELQIILAEPQPRVSELLNGKIANKSVDKLLHYAGRLGIETRARFARRRAPEAEVSRLIGEDAERNGTSKLSTRRIQQVIKAARSARQRLR
jgi:predicted XRE-type DNA-binding protein